MNPSKPPGDMTDEELTAWREELSAEKTRIKGLENDARFIAEARAALAGLSAEARSIVQIHVGGGIAPTGAVASETN